MMPSLPQLLIVLAIVVIIFGLGKFPKIAGDLAKGIKSFKSGMKEEPEEDKEAISKNEEAPVEETEKVTDTSDKKDS